MMRHHRPWHWVAVIVVLALALLAIETAGQATGAQASFEGRPALAGAQAGLGAQAGPPQGGIGLQGSQGAQLNLQPPRMVRDGQEKAPEAQRSEERVLPPAVERDLTPAQAHGAARQARP